EKGQTDPSVLLAVGRKVGPQSIEVFDQNGQHLGSFPFEVTDLWTDPNVGPSAWIAGEESKSRTFESWVAGAQGLHNLDMYPASGKYPLAIVFIETNGNTFGSEELKQAVED